MRTRDIPFRGQRETERHRDRETERERGGSHLGGGSLQQLTRAGLAARIIARKRSANSHTESRAPRIPAEFVPDIAQASKPRVGIAANVPSLITFSSRNHGRVYTYALARVQSPHTRDPKLLPPLPSPPPSSLLRLKLFRD